MNYKISTIPELMARLNTPRICTRCGDTIKNSTKHGRDGKDSELCDVCYWRKRAEHFSNHVSALIDKIMTKTCACGTSFIRCKPMASMEDDYCSWLCYEKYARRVDIDEN